jgi:CubicO group peptidase (beta-lactamase class C family)
MTYRRLVQYLVWASWVLVPVLGQAAGAAPAADRVMASRSGPDAAQLAELLRTFETYAEQARLTWGTPGMAIAVVHRDQVVYSKGFGVKQLGGTDPVDTHTLFPIGSASKAFTSALVALLADEKKLRWEDPVLDHLPTFAMSDPWVTRAFMIEDLMAQRSGMQPYAGDLMAILGFDAPYILSQIKQIPAVSSFRSQFAYVNNLFLVAAEVVSRHTGLSWDEAVRQRLFAPLGMTESSTGHEAYRTASNVAFSHKRVDGRVTSLPPDAPALAWVYTYGPAGGVNSTVHDMAKWLRLHLGQGMFEGQRLIDEADMRAVHTPKTPLPLPPSTPSVQSPFGDMAQFYCEGWIYSAAHPYPVIWHNGDTGGIHSVVGFIPAAQLGLVVLTNLGGTQLPEALLWHLNDLYFGNTSRDWNSALYAAVQAQQAGARAAIGEKPNAAAPALPLSSYAGTFRHSTYGPLTIEPAGESLTLTVGPRRVQMALRHWHRDTFLVSWPENDSYPGDSGFARFTLDPQGQPTSLTLDLFADVDRGVSVRVEPAQPAAP